MVNVLLYCGTVYLNVTLGTHSALSAKGLHFSACRSTMPQNLLQFIGSQHSRMASVPEAIRMRTNLFTLRDARVQLSVPV